MFDKRLRTLRIVAMWCVRQVSPRPPPSSSPSKIDRNSRSRSAKVTTRCVPPNPSSRSEEHTSELQSHSDLVCRLLLEKKKKNRKKTKLLSRNTTERLI